MSQPKQVLIVVTSHNTIPSSGKSTGIWYEEFATPYAKLSALGYAVTVASPKGGAAPVDPGSLSDEEKGQISPALQNTLPLSQVQAEPYAAIIIPGGHGAMFDLPENADLQRLLGDFAAADKVIASICHGLAGLLGARNADGTPFVAGKTITGFTDAEETAAQQVEHMPFLLESSLREQGANFIPAADWSDHIEQDGKLITGQNPQSSASLTEAIVKALAG